MAIKIGNINASYFKVGGADCSIYLGNVKLYPSDIPPTPTGSTCYEIISTPITSYTSTTYDSVYSWSDAKWYMKNNLSQYEEYGIYDFVNDIASATTYNGKLAVVGTTEYQYSGGSWSVVGTYEDASVTYTIDDTSPSPYVGQELATTFKIPYADIDEIGYVDFTITDNNHGEIQISLDTDGLAMYSYNVFQSFNYEGEVTEDGEYFYLSLPSEAPQSFVIGSINYLESTPIHLIAGSKQVTFEYEEKDMPLSNVYNTVADMEAVGCPTVGVGQYGVVGNDAYKFDGEDWNSVSNYKLMEKNADGKANVILCSSSTTLSKSETQPSYFGDATAITSVVIGNCVTNIGNQAFLDCTSLSSIDIPSGVTSISSGVCLGCTSLTSVTMGSGVTSIGDEAFLACTSLSSIDIPSGVTSIGNRAFRQCTSLTSIDIPSGVTNIGLQAFGWCESLSSIDIPSGVTSIGNGAFYHCSSLTSVTIPSGVTSIGDSAFAACSGLTSITVDATTPPTLSNANAFANTPIASGTGYIYVPSESVDTYKAASNWSTYNSRILAKPNS